MKLTVRSPLLLALAALAILSLCLSVSSTSDWDEERERGESAGRREGEEEGRYSSSGGRPYHYGEESFQHRTSTHLGRFRVLDRFTHELIRDSPVGDRRVAVLEAGPRAFLQPSHYDSDEVFYVREGEGVVVMLWKGKRGSFCVREGDVMVIPAGATVYAANTHGSRWFRVVMLLNPVSTPGRFGEFFPVRGDRQDSFFSVFSDDILQAAFNARREEVKKVFEERSEGEITQAPEEQIRALSKSCSRSGSGSGSGKEEIRPTSISSKKPRYSNNHGRLSEITGDECPQLRRLDLEVGLANITRGSMMAMSYSTRETKIAVVVEGSGYFEMACPHLSGSGRRSERRERERESEQEHGSEMERREREREQEHGSEMERRERQEREQEQGSEEERRREREQEGQGGQKSRRYRQVGANIKEGSVIVLPAAHPATFVAGGEGNLAVLCFGVGAERDEKVFLTGKNSPLRQLVEEDEAARKIVFGDQAQDAEKLLRAQTDDVFFRGPRQQRQRDGAVSDM